MNIINAICNLILENNNSLKSNFDSNNRANSMGVALEEYIKDLFAGVRKNTTSAMRLELIQNAFSYGGNQNNPPDAMLRNCDAIEVKKIEGKGNAALALNSSYPKHKLYASSSMITTECKNCEEWSEKDIIYTVGVVNENKLNSLAFVYGEDYCASEQIYERFKEKIKNGVEEISDVDFSETKELGHVNRVDPLGITYLRIRGMWGIENPFTVFDYIYQRDPGNDFNFMAVINNDKYYSFENYVDIEELAEKIPELSIKDVKIKNPNNPVELREAKLITFYKRTSK